MEITKTIQPFQKGRERDPISKAILPGPDSEPVIHLRHFSMRFTPDRKKKPPRKQEIGYMVEVFANKKYSSYFNEYGDTYPTLSEASQAAKEIKAEGLGCRILKCVRRFSIHRVLAK